MKSDDIKILLVEDDDVDAEAVKRVFEEHGLPNPIYRAYNGFEAFDLLRGTDSSKAVERPYIILLDLNMPKMNGIEFLTALRDDKSLSDSVVFVLTTSNDSRDKWEAYQKQIAGYLVKSLMGEDFDKLVNLLKTYWNAVDLPQRPSRAQCLMRQADGSDVQ